jgi:putative endonuclease
MTTWIYFLLCEGDYLYTGVAANPIQRYERHVAGRGARFTRMRRPVQLIGALPFATRTEALSKEYAFKQLSPIEKRRLALAAAQHPAWIGFCEGSPTSIGTNDSMMQPP